MLRVRGEMLRVDRILEDWRGLERMLEGLDFLDFLEVLGGLALYSHFFCVGVLV